MEVDKIKGLAAKLKSDAVLKRLEAQGINVDSLRKDLKDKQFNKPFSK